MSAKREKEKDEFLGTRIREYEILELVGKGGMGAVYRARHLYLDEERAIKVVHSRFADDQKFVDRFIREARMLVRLRHPNLVGFFEFGTLTENTFFMVLEFIRGESVLTRIQRDKRISINDSIRIIREAALGLHAAHQKGIVHRDISPDNLLLVKNDEGEEVVKVIDFGIAKPLLDQNQMFTRTNSFLGKPQFCSPEQCGILQENEVIDHRSDIYSLGITMYYMLAGRLPFRAATPQGYLVKHIQEEPPPISSHFPQGEFPQSLEAIIKKTLAKKREERFSSMEELERSLKEVATSLSAPKESEEVPFFELPSGYLFERRYLIESKIRQHGRTVIYKAMDEILQVPVALKIIERKALQEGKNLERLKRGIILSRKVTHPNVCRVYDVNETKDCVYISMEYIEGQTLTQLIKKEKRLRIDEAVRLTKQLLVGIREAHRAGVIHRNLKPANLIIQPDGQLRIMDFATSISSLPNSVRLTADGEYHGTPTYMAPEQFRDGKVEERSDLYAVSVILYEMITGRLPFNVVTVPALILAHMQSKPLPISQLVPDVPPLLEQMVLKGLEADVEKRFSSADEFFQELLQFERFQTV